MLSAHFPIIRPRGKRETSGSLDLRGMVWLTPATLSTQLTSRDTGSSTSSLTTVLTAVVFGAFGSRNHQNFVQIPHSSLRSKLKALCERSGIKYVEQEESYPSKASFLALRVSI